MASQALKPKVVLFTFEGTDKKGIIATLTSYFYKNNCNILDIDQRILDNTLIMNTVVDCTDQKRSWDEFIGDLQRVVMGLCMKFRLHIVGLSRSKNIALLVTREAHCAEDIIRNVGQKKINGKVAVMIGNHSHLRQLAQRHDIPFFHVSSKNRKQHEAQVLQILERKRCDLVVLARYMQIVSPDFVFRHEGRIINIHPSLLPAFPGPRAYHQAYNKGVDFVGVTAHFVTTDLDEGPIICQGAFRVDKTRHQVDDYIKMGRALEANTLTKAVRLFCADKISLRRGKVIMGRKEHELSAKIKGFYR